MGETHELFANALVLLVGAHVTCLLLLKRPLARFMLFAEAKKKPTNRRYGRILCAARAPQATAPL